MDVEPIHHASWTYTYLEEWIRELNRFFNEIYFHDHLRVVISRIGSIKFSSSTHLSVEKLFDFFAVSEKLNAINFSHFCCCRSC